VQKVKNAMLHPVRTLNFCRSEFENYRTEKFIARANLLWSNQDFILANVDRPQILEIGQFKNIQEAEHQVERFRNIKAIVREVNECQVPGDIVEFGTWQGLGLLLFNLALGDNSYNRKLIGLDSFEGLPENSNGWQKGEFSDTSLLSAKQNLTSHISNGQKFHLIKGWFGSRQVVEEFNSSVDAISIVHFDADLGSSTTTALQMIERYLSGRKMPIYFLFDDWGCHPDEIPEAFNLWLERASIQYRLKAEKISSTRFTRYYRIVFKS
jgi:hypothetical protein